MKGDSCDCRCRGCQGTLKGVQLFSGTRVLGPWMRRRGDYVRATADVTNKKGDVNLVVRMFTKNSENRGDGIDVDSTRTITTEITGRKLQEWGTTGVGIRELVRYEYECNVVTTPGWVRFRMLGGCWFEAAGLGGGGVVLPPPEGE